MSAIRSRTLATEYSTDNGKQLNNVLCIVVCKDLFVLFVLTKINVEHYMQTLLYRMILDSVLQSCDAKIQR